MAAGGDTNCNITFSSKQTVKVGNGDAGEGVLAIPERMRLEKETINCLVDNIFPDIEQRYTDTKWLANRAILCPSNKEVDEVNEEVLRRLPGEERILKSIDTTEENSPEYTPEFLNSLEMSGIPPHLLKLKPGCIVILLRNMDSEAGHCNGVKYCVVNILPHIIELRSVWQQQRVHPPLAQHHLHQQDQNPPLCAETQAIAHQVGLCTGGQYYWQ